MSQLTTGVLVGSLCSGKVVCAAPFQGIALEIFIVSNRLEEIEPSTPDSSLWILQNLYPEPFIFS